MEQSRIRFDKTVNLGHILTFLGFVFTGFAAWTSLDKRVVVLETQVMQQQKRDDLQDQTLRDNLNEIKRSLEKIADRLDQQQKQR